MTRTKSALFLLPALLLYAFGCSSGPSVLEEAESLCDGLVALTRVDRCVLAGEGSSHFYVIEFDWQDCDEANFVEKCGTELVNAYVGASLLAGGPAGLVFISHHTGSYSTLSRPVTLACAQKAMRSQSFLQGEVTEDSLQDVTGLFISSENSVFTSCVSKAAAETLTELTPEQLSQYGNPIVSKVAGG